MKIIKRSLLACLILLAGCNQPSGPEIPPGTTGFYVQTHVDDYTIPETGPEPYVFLDGNWDHNIEKNSGSDSPFAIQTQFDGVQVLERAAPAVWLIEWMLDEGGSLHGNDCNGLSAYYETSQFGTTEVDCEIFGIGVNVASPAAVSGFSPDPVYRAAPPSVGTISGLNVSAKYAMPFVEYYDVNGTYVAGENASYVSPDGTWIQIPSFSISQLAAGNYFGYIYEKNSSGAWTSAGVVQTDLATTTPVYRWLQVNNGGHYWATTPSDCCALSYEGVGYHIFNAEIGGTMPFYELVNASIGKYFYTANYNEMYNCVHYYGWTYIGILGYIAGNQLSGTVPLYRLSATTGDHLFTVNWSEVQSAVAGYGYTYEGVAGYVPTE